MRTVAVIFPFLTTKEEKPRYNTTVGHAYSRGTPAGFSLSFCSETKVMLLQAPLTELFLGAVGCPIGGPARESLRFRRCW